MKTIRLIYPQWQGANIARWIPNIAPDDASRHMDIFLNMKNSKPCLGCAGGRRFTQSTRADIVNARRILGI